MLAATSIWRAVRTKPPGWTGQKQENKTELIDEAVARVLTKNSNLALFDDPFRFCNQAREKSQENVQAHKDAARSLSRKSIVLLKMKTTCCPYPKNKTVAFIGPFAKSVRDNLGFWSMEWRWWHCHHRHTMAGHQAGVISWIATIVCRRLSHQRPGFQRLCTSRGSSRTGRWSFWSVGRRVIWAGKPRAAVISNCRAYRDNWSKAIHATGKPVVLLINAGRPLVFTWASDNIPAIVYTWWLGSEAGHAIADVLFGDYNPSGKITMSFPRSGGQVPIYYNYRNTGRPAPNDSTLFYVSGYIDLLHSPRYPFGYGIGYSPFQYSGFTLSKSSLRKAKTHSRLL